jgi:hypothetical protein
MGEVKPFSSSMTSSKTVFVRCKPFRPCLPNKLNVIKLYITMLHDIMLCVIMLSDARLNVIRLIVVMLRVLFLIVLILSVLRLYYNKLIKDY